MLPPGSQERCRGRPPIAWAKGAARGGGYWPPGARITVRLASDSDPLESAHLHHLCLPPPCALVSTTPGSTRSASWRVRGGRIRGSSAHALRGFRPGCGHLRSRRALAAGSLRASEMRLSPSQTGPEPRWGNHARTALWCIILDYTILHSILYTLHDILYTAYDILDYMLYTTY